MNTTLVAPRQASFDARFWFGWVGVTMIGWYLGAWFASWGMLSGGNRDFFLGVGIGVGLFQWLFLRTQAAVPRSVWWAPAGAVGVALPLILYILIWGEPVDPGWLQIWSDRYVFTFGQAEPLLLAAVAGGALAGLLQYLLLRRRLSRAWWWVPASAAGWGLGLLGQTAEYAPYAMSLAYGFQMLLSQLLLAVLPGLLLGVVTGGTLVWLLHAPAPTPAARPAALWARPGLVLIAVLAAPPLAFLVFGMVGPMLRFTLTTPAEIQYRAWTEDSGYGQGIAFSPDGTRLAATLPDKGGVVIELATGRTLLSIPGAFDAREGATTDVVFSPDGALLATADDFFELWPNTWVVAPSNPTVRLWDAATGAEVRALLGQGEGATRAVFSPDGTLLAVGTEAGPHAGWVTRVRLLDVARGAEVRTFGNLGAWVQDLAFSPDGRLLAAGMISYKGGPDVRLWEVSTGHERWTLREEEGARLVAFSPDGSLLATGSYTDGTIRLWDVATGAAIRTLEAHEQAVTRAAFSPDGRLLATASDDRTVKLWDVATGEVRHTLEGHTWWVRGVAFSPDGATLASASFDGTVKLWDVATGKEVRSIAWPETP